MKTIKTYLDAGEFRYKISKSIVEVIGNQTSSREFILGIRPEDVILLREPRENAIKANILISEPIGHRMIIHVTVGGYVTIKANIPCEAVSPGQDVWITFDENKIYIFDKASGSAII